MKSFSCTDPSTQSSESTADVGLAVMELLFNLLSLCRRGEPGSPPPTAANLQQRRMHYWQKKRLPRLNFWLGLLRHAGLLDEAGRPTPLVPDWLSAPLSQRFRDLAYAWAKTPSTQRRQHSRLRALLDLEQNCPTTSPQGLVLLGLANRSGLTDLGRQALQNAPMPPEPAPALWRMDLLPGSLLGVPYPPDWSLLWELETYLDPLKAGLYLLDEAALRRAVQRGALKGMNLEGELPALVRCLARGTGQPIPDWLLEKLKNTPSARLLTGLTVEFCDPAELTGLRKNWRLRKKLSDVLSPRHLHLSEDQAMPILRQLCRHGVLSQADLERASAILEPDTEAGMPAGKTARAYLLYLAQLAQLLPGAAWAPPPGLKEKLLAGLEPALTASALNRAKTTAARLLPPRLEAAPPPPANLSPEERARMLAVLQEAIRTQSPVDITYHTSGREKPETRHITPLMIEHANGHDYLLAYCHIRRDNRIFRLDRLVLLSR
ncbi:MAG TPA: WYL domain-containing protein [Anaerolineaceae bacterium]|nr:WYL domain-containing protein [Anaerolineaceae bacterium]